MAAISHQWPAEGLTRVPYWVYCDRDTYEEEQARIFRGPTWSFLCLEAELPGPNSYRRSNLGAMPVVVTRDEDGTLHGFENRCAHRGSLLVLNESGEARDIICVYHNWSYDLSGNLTGVAFRKGLGGKGGMPAECRPEDHAPRKLRLETLAGPRVRHLSADAPPLEHYLGPEIVRRIRRVMRAPVKLLGGYSQTLPSNWKLYMENVKDTYHASLLHTFFTTFRLNRLSQKGGIVVSDSGGHHVSYSMRRRHRRQGIRAGRHARGAGRVRARSAASCWKRSTSSATASACRSCRCSRASCCSRPATAWRCAGWCRRVSRRPSWSGPASASPPTTRT